MHLPSLPQLKIKSYIHGFQGFLIFLVWALTIAVFTKPGNTDGRTKYLFVLCWLCIPALIYLTATPIFEKTKRFAHPYAFATIDILYTIFWFAAFISVATWTNDGIKAGEAKLKAEKKEGKKGCAAFGYGSESKCTISKASIWFGVLIFLLFIVTSFLSIKTAVHFRRTGSLPGHTSPSNRGVDEDQAKYAFSANPHDDVEEDIEDRPPTQPKPTQREDDEHALLHTDTEDGTHPGRPLSWGREHAPTPAGGLIFDATDTSYHGGRVPVPRANVYATNNPPTYGSDRRQAGDPFRDDVPLSHGHSRYGGGGRAQFPDAEYNHGGGARVEFPDAEYNRLGPILKNV